MLPVRVVLLPTLLRDDDVRGRAVVVFDVLRATTTMAAALDAGVREIRVFDALADAQQAATAFDAPRLLCGEHECLKPAGFDLGNSPGDYTPERCEGRTMFLATTNGTRALVAAREAERLFTGSLVNASATARELARANLPVTLLCAGTHGQVAMEDLLGCGCVIDKLGDCFCQGDAAHLAYLVFRTLQVNVVDYLRLSQGGRNITRAGLEADIAFAAQVDRFDLSVQVTDRQGLLVAARGNAYS